MFIHDDSDIPRDVMDGINVPNWGGRFRLFRYASVQVVCGLRRNSAPAEIVAGCAVESRRRSLCSVIRTDMSVR